MTPRKGRHPRQARALETRDAVLDAVTALAMDQPTRPVTTTAIAARAHVAVGTVYRYFENEEAAVLAAYDRALERLHGRWFGGLPALRGLTAEEQAAALFQTYVDSAAKEPAYVPLLRQARRHRTAEAEYAANVETPESHRAFADIFGLPIDPSRITHVKLLKFVTLRLMDLYFLAADQERPAIAAEVRAYAADALSRLRSE